MFIDLLFVVIFPSLIGCCCDVSPALIGWTALPCLHGWVACLCLCTSSQTRAGLERGQAGWMAQLSQPVASIDLVTTSVHKGPCEPSNKICINRVIIKVIVYRYSENT